MNQSKREMEIDSFINSIMTQEKWENDKNIYIDNIINKHNKYLEDYIIVLNKEEYDMINLGGYIRYVDSMNVLKWGGILLKKIKKNDIDYMILGNSNMKRITVSFYKNTIFYKKHTTASDKTKKLFISYLDKYTD